MAGWLGIHRICTSVCGLLLTPLLLLLMSVTISCDEVMPLYNTTSHLDYQSDTDTFQCFQTCMCHMKPLPSTTIALYSSCSLTAPDMSLPDPIMGELYNVSVLHFEYAVYETLPAMFCDVTDQLEHFAWQNSHVTNLYEDIFSCLSTLISLDLNNNEIIYLTNGSLTGLFNLQYLAISRNNISKLEPNCFPNDLQSLEKIDLSFNFIKSLPDEVFRNLSSLQHINLEHNALKTLEGGGLRGLVFLQVLDLSYNQIVSLSGVFSSSAKDSFQSLQYLNLSNNEIEILLPGMFDGLIELIELNLRANRINTVPRGAFTLHLGGLINLQLSHNQIESLQDEALADLHKLAALNLSNNFIKEVRADLFTRVDNIVPNHPHSPASNANPNHYKLDILDLSHNNISKIPRTAFEYTLAGIRTILLGFNHITSLPRYGIETLKSLEHIDLQHNRIAWLDVGTFKNSRLKTINLSHNKMVKLISMAFLYLPEIEYVDLSHNKLNYLYKYIFYKTCSPKEDTRLIINCDHNQLESDSIWKLLSTFRHLEGTTCSVDVKLRHNQITHLLGDALETYQRHLSYYDFSYFRTWDHVHFDINNNPIDCDCSLYDDAETLKGIYSTFVGNFTHKSNLNFWEHLTCSHPTTIEGRQLTDVLPDIKCKVTDFCPTLCDCVYIPSRERYIVNCSGRDLKQFPASFPSGLKEVYLQGNKLHSVFANISLYDVVYLDLSNNELAYIDRLVWQKLISIPVVLLYDNRLSRLPRRSLQEAELKTHNLSLVGNLFGCTCEDVWLKAWLLNHSHVIQGAMSLRCGPGSLQGKIIVQVDDNDFDCPSATLEDPNVFRGYETSSPSFIYHTSPAIQVSAPIPIINILIFILAPSMFLGFIIATLVYRFRHRIRIHAIHQWRPRHLDEDSIDVKHDIFISFCHSDNKWVRKDLVQRLTSHSPPYTVYMQPQDWKTGALLTDYLLEGMDRCESSIVVFSHNLLHMEWTTEETKNILQQLLQNRSKRTFVIFLDGEPVRTLNMELDNYLRETTCLNVQDQLFWEKLFYLLPQPQTTVGLLTAGARKDSIEQDLASAHHKKY